MGFLDDVFGGGAGKSAARKNMGLLSDLERRGTGFIDTAATEAGGQLDEVDSMYGDMAQMGLEGLDYLPEALGLRGEEGNARTMERFQTGPAYEFQMNQGLDALERRAGARGQLNSGNTTIDTIDYASGLANSEFGGWLDRITGLDTANRDFYKTGTAGSATAKMGLADLAVGTGDRRLNLASEVVNGKMGANNDYATAKNQGIGNIGSFLAGGAKLLGGYL